MDIEPIRRAILQRQYRYTKHAVEQRIDRKIYENEIEEAISGGEIIEDYPNDKYGPSCLVYGKTKTGRPLHIQIARFPMTTIVTVYEPDPKEWIDNRLRR